LTFAIESARRAAQSCAAAQADPFILTAGGSEFFDIVTDRLRGADIGRSTQVILRSGCYLTQDHAHYARAFERIAARGLHTGRPHQATLRAALEVWGCVQSRPEPGRAYVTGGKRDLSFDMDLPTPVAWYRPGAHHKPQSLPPGHHASAINDQHLHLAIPGDSPLGVGDLVALGISHPCTTFDKWQLIYVVDDDYTVVDAIRTFF
jgi:D-serine dehydratase